MKIVIDWREDGDLFINGGLTAEGIETARALASSLWDVFEQFEDLGPDDNFIEDCPLNLGLLEKIDKAYEEFFNDETCREICSRYRYGDFGLVAETAKLWLVEHGLDYANSLTDEDIEEQIAAYEKKLESEKETTDSEGKRCRTINMWQSFNHRDALKLLQRLGKLPAETINLIQAENVLNINPEHYRAAVKKHINDKKKSGKEDR